MKKQFMENTPTDKKDRNDPRLNTSWNNRRKVITKNISVELDLEAREININEGGKDLPVQFVSNNIDAFLNNHVDPRDLTHVMESLSEAKKGIEKPIRFGFIHPHVPMPVKYEYHYQIVYVKYSHTKLQGVLVKAKTCRKKH